MKSLINFGLGPVFSDEEFESVNICPSTAPANKMDYPEEPPLEMKKAREAPFSLPPNLGNASEDNEDVEQELDMFNKAIHISNIDEVSFSSMICVFYFFV